MANKEIKKVNWWHEAIIDWMMENPHGKLRECAAHFEVTQGWLSVIINSHAFQELLAQRKMVHAHVLSLTLTEQLEGIAAKSADALDTALDEAMEEGTMSVGCARDTMESAMKLLGYGARSQAALNINTGGAPVQVNQVTPEVLSSARDKMRLIQEKRLELREVESNEQEALPVPTPS